MFKNIEYNDIKEQPALVYIELEEIASRLLFKDLINKESLAYYVFFDRELRGHVLENLNCTRICWDNEKLDNIINKDCDKKIYRESIAGCGTHFFWG